VLNNFEEVLAQKNLTAAKRQYEYAGISQIIQERLDLKRRHLSVVMMVEITMHAALVAAVSKIELNVEGDVEPMGLRRDLLHQAAHGRDPAKAMG
jgi:hypothetical protein